MNIYTIKRIPTEVLLEIIQDLWDNGVDFIDIYGQDVNENESHMVVSYSKEYINEEYVDSFEFDNVEEQKESVKTISVKLNDEDVNNLLK